MLRVAIAFLLMAFLTAAATRTNKASVHKRHPHHARVQMERSGIRDTRTQIRSVCRQFGQRRRGSPADRSADETAGVTGRM